MTRGSFAADSAFDFAGALDASRDAIENEFAAALADLASLHAATNDTSDGRRAGFGPEVLFVPDFFRRLRRGWNFGAAHFLPAAIFRGSDMRIALAAVSVSISCGVNKSA
jgi:hypothetical protein